MISEQGSSRTSRFCSGNPSRHGRGLRGTGNRHRSRFAIHWPIATCTISISSSTPMEFRRLSLAMDKAGVAEDHDFPNAIGGKNEDPHTPSCMRQPQYYLDDDARCYWYSATDIEVAREVSKLPEVDRKPRFPPVHLCEVQRRGIAMPSITSARCCNGILTSGRRLSEVMTRHDDLTALTEIPHPA